MQEAVSEAAPQALQIADRFHILKNLTEATQILLARCQTEIREASQQKDGGYELSTKHVLSVEEWRPLEPAHVEKVRLARRAGRHERYQLVMELHDQGMNPKRIAQRLDLGERTIQKWIAAETFPETKRRRKRQSCFDTFAPYCRFQKALV